ncbi:MAG: LysR family transcriptional regulator [Eubacteriales bacterium]
MQEYKYVYEVYKEHSFSKAAKNLYISQPALSATIKKIEDRLGLQLFDRSSTALNLTKAGEAYIQTARKIMNLEDELNIYLQDLANLKTGSLILAGTAFFSSYIIPPIVKEYQNRYPGVNLEFIESDSLALYKRAQENRIDLIVDGGEYNRDRFERKVLFQETILLAVPRCMLKENHDDIMFSVEDICNNKHKSPELGCINVKEFENQSFLLLKRKHDLYHRGMEICKEQECSISSFIHLNQLMTVYNLVCQNLGIGFVTDTLIKCSKVQADVVYFKIHVNNEALLKRDVFIAYRKNSHITKAMHSFMDVAREYYG